MTTKAQHFEWLRLDQKFGTDPASPLHHDNRCEFCHHHKERMRRRMKVKEIGDRSSDGLLEITDTRWDSNGTLFVAVRETMGGGALIGGFPVRRARTLARSALPEYYPGQTRSSRMIGKFKDGPCEAATFAVSRLPRY